MEEAFELEQYLPLSFKTPKEAEYIAFLWDAFRTNYEHGKYQFAFLAYHMLTMSFVYFNIWQIRQAKPREFEMGLIGFGRDEKAMLDAKSPFAFSVVPEKTALRFLRLIQCDNAKIGAYGKLVESRNETAHPNGNIFFSTRQALDIKLREVLKCVAEIQAHSKPVIEHCYQDFLRSSQDAEEREYPDDADQIKEVLIHSGYISTSDIDICAKFDISHLSAEPRFAAITALHLALRAVYPDEQDMAA